MVQVHFKYCISHSGPRAYQSEIGRCSHDASAYIEKNGLEYTKNNHVDVGFTCNDDFYFKHGTVTSYSSWRDECKSTAQQLYDLHGNNLVLLLSGGLDSQFSLALAKELKKDIGDTSEYSKDIDLVQDLINRPIWIQTYFTENEVFIFKDYDILEGGVD